MEEKKEIEELFKKSDETLEKLKEITESITEYHLTYEFENLAQNCIDNLLSILKILTSSSDLIFLTEYSRFIREHSGHIIRNNCTHTVYLQLICSAVNIPLLSSISIIVHKYTSHWTKDNIIFVNKTCQDFRDLVYQYYKYVNQKNQIEFQKTSFQFALKYLLIIDFQCIKYIEKQLPVDAQFIVFAGENGDGKTSILQALSMGLYNSDDLPESEKGRKDTVIHVQYKSEENSFHNEIYNNPDLPTLYTLRKNIAELKPFASYGASRLKVLEQSKPQNPLLNLNTDKSQLINIFTSWLRDVSVNEPAKFTEIKKTILKLLPHISDIVKEDESKIISDFVFIEKGNRVDFQHLSAGHKSIVLMVGDMLMRLSEAQPEIQNPSDLAGIVLIDELEAHLHPKWQKEFPKILAEIFPKVQFIVTTHSAVCLLGMPENSVFFKVKRSEEHGTQIDRIELDIKNLLPNQILSSPIFGLENIKSVANEDINEVRLEDDYQEIIKRDEVRENIAKLLTEKYKKD